MSCSDGPDGLSAVAGILRARIALAIAFSLRTKSFSVTAVSPARRAARTFSATAVNSAAERVTVTGTLVDREIRVRTIQSVAASCSLQPRVKV